MSPASDDLLKASEAIYNSISDNEHKRLDQAVNNNPIVEFFLHAQIIGLEQPLNPKFQHVVLSAICQSAADYGLKPLGLQEAEKLIAQYPQLGSAVNEAWIQGAHFKKIRGIPLLRENPQDAIGSTTNEPLYRASVRVTEKSWDHSYIGDAYLALEKHITEYRKNLDNSYVPYCAIVQSSGTGKSRTVDEFSKYHFVVPLNLRKPSAEGFPPSDPQVYNFLASDSVHELSKRDLDRQVEAFMIALFEKCNEVIKRVLGDHPGENWLETQAAMWFRGKMTEGQSFGSQGAYRIQFYDDVIKNANKIIQRVDLPKPKKARNSDPTQDPLVYSKANELTKNWKETSNVIIYLAFDEAHSLTRRMRDTGKGTETGADADPPPFYYLRKVLRACRTLPLFTIFLSTTARIDQFIPPKEDDDSARLQRGELRPIPPFCALGWDHGALPFPAQMKLSSVASIEYKASLGRPLFAFRYRTALNLNDQDREEIIENIVSFTAQKLIRRDTNHRPDRLTRDQELACLSARLPIEFMSSIPTQAEQDQIGNHMRVCLSVDEGFLRFTSFNPSEPIVAEGAYNLMYDNRLSFNAPRALSNVLHGFSVHQGDRGELVAMLLITLARDSAISSSSNGVCGVVEFLQKLIYQPTQSSDRFSLLTAIKPSVYQGQEDQNTTLESAFCKIQLHFNHFVKRQQKDHLSDEVLRGFIARCAAVMGANNQSGFDLVAPTVMGDELSKSSQGFIMWQVKNDESYTAKIQTELFDQMDPVRMGFLGKEERLATPIIRIVFALAAKTPAIRYVQTQNEGNFTSYDIWISGLSSKVFNVVSPSDEATWKTLLDVSQRWKAMYRHKDTNTMKLMKNMNPMVANDENFWEFKYRNHLSEPSSPISTVI
ncbi:hypothetical protein D9757_010297 [Collybiopsis confluens]|uniref:Uncharacterized protein n=1 Tax=Collybiopsis confluens TaxID=2823264 RepID=A0A8H5LV10_9AGAR|nr:hypothetical protein D9757_010297 [Collybiopsis confluens]